MNPTDILRQLYLLYIGHEPESIEAFPSSGSNRRYFRLAGQPTLIGVRGESAEENRAFIYLAGHFRKQGLPVPQVYAHSDDFLYYLQEDLGDTLLFDKLGTKSREDGASAELCQLLRQVIRLLPVLQCKGAEGLDFSQCYPQPAFNRRSVLWDLNYFKYCFLKATGIDFQEDRLEDDFQAMAEVLLEEDTPTSMYRDFQSRNVMLRGDAPWFIDFQGGRRGPVYYDVASFLWQAKANFPDNLRQALVDEYIDALRPFRPVDEAHFKSRLRHFVLFRTLQVLGTYGFRGYFERKPHFLQSVPYALANLRNLLQEPYKEYPYLSDLLRRMTELERFAPTPQTDHLVVRVASFAYPKGIPEDPSGNGGGFVFDCRAIHNPGRYAAYKSLTGRDEPVIRFLENDGEISVFLDHVYALVDASVRRYLKRGFTSLCVSFGCTGGQHRSVYAAEHLARHLNDTFGVHVELWHREQGIRQTYPLNTAEQ
ncbi:MAG TPA: phosphotransferase [Candidatus Bacteroides pullicola]|uniref:Phosphotransferase n=1 Tax=Candidatus Bacteroides pullicola TaxID=2838475 RepID=A0A9D1ZJ72_9BACE|nr:phosphotransferase [Candidatus Bacteroides pullicola]